MGGYYWGIFMASQIDLHCHTTASDGALAPEALIDRAIDRNVATLAITDHDTMAGYRQVADYAKERGYDFIFDKGGSAGLIFSKIDAEKTDEIIKRVSRN